MTLSLLTVLFAVNTGFAAEPALMKEFHSSCRPDVEKFCKGVQPGEGRIAQCLKENEKDLSSSCATQRTEVKAKIVEKRAEKREEFKQKRKEIREACLSEIKSFCGSIRGPLKIARCLGEHQSDPKFSQACKDALPKPKS